MHGSDKKGNPQNVAVVARGNDFSVGREKLRLMTEDPVLLNDWHPVVTVAELEETPVIGTRLLDEDIVVWRAGDQVHAWRDSCVHRGTKLSLGKIIDDACIQCPYHGWVYDSEGQCIRIPAIPDHTPPTQARIKTFEVREAYELVWVCMGKPANEIPPFPEWDKPDFRKLLCGPHPVQTSGPRIIENFSMSHTSRTFTKTSLGTQEHTEVIDYEVTTGATGVVATNVKFFQTGSLWNRRRGHGRVQLSRSTTTDRLSIEGIRRPAIFRCFCLSLPILRSKARPGCG